MGDVLVLQDKELLVWYEICCGMLPAAQQPCTATRLEPLRERGGSVRVQGSVLARDRSCALGLSCTEPLCAWLLWLLPARSSGICLSWMGPGRFTSASAFGNLAKLTAWKCFHAVPMAPPWRGLLWV